MGQEADQTGFDLPYWISKTTSSDFLSPDIVLGHFEVPAQNIDRLPAPCPHDGSSVIVSFNNDGPLGTFFRYIGDSGTYLARYDDLFTGKEEPIDVSSVDVSMNGIELQDREFFAAIREGREPNSSVASVLPCYEVMHQLEQQLK